MITAILPGRYTVPIEFPNVKALPIVEGEMRFDLNYSVFNCSYQTHSIATTRNCFCVEAREGGGSLLNNRISLPFWVVRVRDGLEVIGYMLNRPYPLKWNIVHGGKNLQLTTANVVSRGYGKYVMLALERWMAVYGGG